MLTMPVLFKTKHLTGCAEEIGLSSIGVKILQNMYEAYVPTYTYTVSVNSINLMYASDQFAKGFISAGVMMKASAGGRPNKDLPKCDHKRGMQ